MIAFVTNLLVTLNKGNCERSWLGEEQVKP